MGDGPHTIYVRAYDDANNVRTASVTFTVDVTSPSVSIVTPNEGALVTSIVIEWNGTDATSGIQGYQYRIDNGTWSTSAMTLTTMFTGKADGGHFVEVMATDRSGNFATASVHLTLDTSAPVVAITSPATGFNSSSPTVIVNWTGSDAITAIQGYEYRIDSEDWSAESGSATHSFTGLDDGIHTVLVKAFDLVGNAATTSVTFRVDTVDPTVSVTAPANGYYSASTIVTVDWTGSDSGSGIAGYQYRIDGQGWTAIAGITTYSFSALSQGDHTVDVRSVDRAGNDLETSVTFNVDTVTPNVGITVPMEGLITNATTVPAFWTGSDPTSGIKGYQYQIDTGPWSVMSLAQTHDFTGLDDGPHTISVRAYDNADNSATALVHIMVDTVDPTLSIDAPAEGALINVSSASVSWSAGDSMSGLLGTQYSLDGGSWSALSAATTETFSGLTDGHHVVYVRAFDRANNTYNASVGFTVDTVAPSLTIGHPGNGAIISDPFIRVDWTGSDAVSGIVGYQSKLNGGDWSGLSMDLNSSFNGLADGPHTVSVRAFDAAGHFTVKTVSFVSDTVAPVLTITSPMNGTYWNTPTVRVTWTSSDATTSVLDYRIKAGDGQWVSGITDLYADVAFTGNHTVILEAVDLAGNVRQVTVYFTIDTQAPALSILQPVEGHFLNVSWVNLTWSGNDAISSIASYQVRVDGMEWSSPQQSSFLNVTGLSDGEHLAEVKATDLAGNEIIVSVHFVVDTTNPTVTITAPSAGYCSSSSSVSVNWNGDDIGVGVQAYKYRINGGPWSPMTTDTGHTFDLADGNYTVDVLVYDWSNNSATGSISYTVDTAVPVLGITAPVNPSFTNATTVTVNWTASDATAGVRGYKYRLDTGPWSFESMAVTSSFTGLADGLHTVTVQVFDRAGNMAETSVTFTVDTVGPALNVSAPTDGAILDHADVDVSWSAADVTTWIDGYSYSVDGGAWSPLSMGTEHVFAGLPEGMHTVQIMAYDHVRNPVLRSVTFMVDTVDPIVGITLPDEGIFTNSSIVKVNWTGSDMTSHLMGFSYRLDAGEWSDLTYARSHDFGALTDGWHTVYVEAEDNASNEAQTSVRFLVDTTPPSVTIITPLPTTLVNSSVVTWTGSDAASDIRGYQFRLDDGGWSPLSAGLEKDPTGLSDGHHDVYVRAWDWANNTATASVGFVYDTVAPYLIIVSPADGSGHNLSGVDVAWTASDNASTVTGYQYRLDNGAWSGLTDSLEKEFSGLADGWHNVTVRAFDGAGNCAEKRISVLIDTQTPVVVIADPYTGQEIGTSSVRFAWTVDDRTSGLQNVRYRLNGGEWVQLGGAASQDFVLTLDDGPNTMVVQAFDNENNVVTENVTFTVDTVAPVLSLDSPNEGAPVPTSWAVVAWHADDLTTSVAGYQYRIDGGEWSSPSMGTSFNFTTLGEGQHKVDVLAFDRLGNTIQRGLNFTVDTVSPVVNISGPVPGAYLNASSVQVSWTGSDATTGIQGYEFRTNGGQWSSMTMETGVLMELADGNYTVEVRASDMAGNSATKTIAFTIDTVPPMPVFVIPSRDINISSPSASISWTATDATSGVKNYSFRLDGGDWEPMGTALGITVSGMGEGRHTMDIMATDRANNSAVRSVNLTVDTVSPVLDILSPSDGVLTNTTSVTVTWTGSDATTGIAGYRYSIDGGAWSPMSMALRGSFIGLADGVHTVLVRATDNAGNSVTVQVRFTVDTVPPVLVISAPGRGWISNLSSVAVIWSANDHTTGVLGYQYRIDGSAWSPISNRTERVFDGLADGTHSVEVRSWDNSGNDAEASMNFVVDTVAPAVRITSPASGAFVNGTRLVWTGTDATSGIRGYQYRLDGGVWSPVLTSTGHSFAGLADGEHIVEIRTIDNASNSATTSVRFVLDTVRPAAVMLAPDGGERLNQSTVGIGWSMNGTGSPLDQMWTSLDGGVWVERDISTLEVSFTGLADGVHDVRLRLTDAAGNTNTTSASFLVDTTAPTITEYPTGTNVPTNAGIKVNFSEEMDIGTVTIDVSGVSGTTSWNGHNLTLTPSQPLAHSHSYTVSVHGKDLAGNPVSGQWTFSVVANGTMYGKITDSKGRPIANATITAGGKSVTSDADGMFVINLVDGDYNVTITKDGKFLANVTATSVAGEGLDLGSIAVPGSDVSGPDDVWGWVIGAVVIGTLLTLLVAARRRRFYVVVNDTTGGQVLDPHDRPIGEAEVALENGTTAVTDADGRFGLQMGPGVHRMTVGKNGRKSRSFHLPVIQGQTYRTRMHRMRRR